jgi:hypothetical protein
VAYAADLFDAGRARDAHEEWEVAWRAATGDVRAVLKALCCVSAGVVKHTEGSPGAPVLVDRARAAFADAPPEVVVGGVPIRGEVVLERVLAWQRGGPWPTLT